MASIKFVAFAALLLVLNMHWAQCQYLECPNYYYPQIYGKNDNNNLDAILPILILAMFGRNSNGFGGCGGGYRTGCECGGCGGGSGCGGCRGGCGCGGGYGFGRC